MFSRARHAFADLLERFWLVPALLVACGIVVAVGLIEVDRENVIPARLLNSRWFYDGGSTGARTLLGAVASSTIGVAGTVFSITIAALSLAAGQMGPRLLRSFTKDRGNQFTLGIFLGTFAYALMVLRSVRDASEGAFVPHLALSVAIALSIVCTGTLVYFVGHMASRISVESVIGIVEKDVRAAFERLTTVEADTSASPAVDWTNAQEISANRSGYVQRFEKDVLADWAASRGATIRLLVRPGDFVFPGSTFARVVPAVADVEDALRSAVHLGAQRAGNDDLTFAIRQLVEVAVRALSPGINDPETAMSVLDLLGATLCEAAPRCLETGIVRRASRVVVVMPPLTYEALCEAMFTLIRRNAGGSASILHRMLFVFAAAASVETDRGRRETLQRHVALVCADAEREVANASDLATIHAERRRFDAALVGAPDGPS
jgi:uncharacterized membrane protein